MRKTFIFKNALHSFIRYYDVINKAFKIPTVTHAKRCKVKPVSVITETLEASRPVRTSTTSSFLAFINVNTIL